MNGKAEGQICQDGEKGKEGWKGMEGMEGDRRR
jgi:hypothetical protein